MSTIKVLQILAGAKEFNGVSGVLLSYYSHMNRGKVHFDFLFCRENTMLSMIDEDYLKESQFFELNAKVSGTPGDLLSLTHKITLFLKEHRYDIVHINTGSISIATCCVFAARRAHIQRIIAHSHSTDPVCLKQDGRLKKIIKSAINGLARPYIRNKSSLLFACSKEAGQYLFGHKSIALLKYYQINNAIQTDKYLFNSTIRDTIRNSNRLENDTVVLGCVGRFSKEKNHVFLINVFNEFQKKEPNSVLWLVGEGPTKKEIEFMVKSYGLSEKVVFWGYRQDVNRLLQAMDCFVLASYYEGLALVSIEAQASGLFVYLSDETPHGCAITDLVHFLPLTAGAEEWAERIRIDLKIRPNRSNMKKEILDAGYDINQQAITLETIYEKIMNLV